MRFAASGVNDPPRTRKCGRQKRRWSRAFPERFSSVSGVNSAIAGIYTDSLPQTYYQDFAKNIDAVTKEDVVRVARQYIDPEHLAIVIVGDRHAIEAAIEATHVAPIVVLDLNGDPAK